jgi:hypothetical protein
MLLGGAGGTACSTSGAFGARLRLTLVLVLLAGLALRGLVTAFLTALAILLPIVLLAIHIPSSGVNTTKECRIGANI